MEVDEMQPLVQMRDTWTVDDLQTLDVQDWWRYEIVDGALVVSPPAANPHELASAELSSAVWPALPDGLIIAGPSGVEIGSSYLIPDLIVVRRERLRDASLLRPDEVLLAVEIVSPGSVTMDRVTKPAKYAAAGVVNFWRVELDPVSLTAYALPPDADVYREVGTWGTGETAYLDQPFRCGIELDRLV